MAEDEITYPNSSEVSAGQPTAASHYNNARKDERTKYLQIVVFDFDVSWAVGDGAYYFEIPKTLNGHKIKAVHAKAITAGTTGTSDIQIYNVTDGVDLLSTKLTIDSGSTGSNAAATPAVINTANNTVATYDLWRVDIDAIASTPPKGLLLTIGFEPQS